MVKKVSQKKVWVTVVAILILLTGGSIAQGGTKTSSSATVVKVVDGDTLKVLINSEKESVRLIGIDTPEREPNEKAFRDAKRTNKDLKTIIAQGEKSAEVTRSFVKQGDSVRLEFDVEKRDKFGRLLAYVYLPDGRMLNEEVLKAGQARLMTYPPNVRYLDRLKLALKMGQLKTDNE